MTGSRGPISKPDHLRQRRNKSRSPLVLLPAGDAKSSTRTTRATSTKTAKTPKAPEGLLKVTLDRWRAFWKSSIATRIQEVHLPMVERLFERYDERERARRTVKEKGRVSQGSRGQVVMNPLVRYIAVCDAEIGKLEDRLGLSLRALTQNGGSEQPSSLDELNAQLEADNETDVDDDPRLSIAN